MSYNVTTTQITRIKSKKAWSHITRDLPDIELSHRTKRLTSVQKEELVSYCKGGLTLNEAKSKANFYFTKNQYYDLRRIR